MLLVEKTHSLKNGPQHQFSSYKHLLAFPLEKCYHFKRIKVPVNSSAIMTLVLDCITTSIPPNILENIYIDCSVDFRQGSL